MKAGVLNLMIAVGISLGLTFSSMEYTTIVNRNLEVLELDPFLKGGIVKSSLKQIIDVIKKGKHQQGKLFSLARKIIDCLLLMLTLVCLIIIVLLDKKGSYHKIKSKLDGKR